MSVNHLIENNWDEFPDFDGSPSNGDKVVVVSDGVAYKTKVSDLIRSGGGGWGNYTDATHTIGSPQSVISSTRTLVTIDGAGGATNTEYINDLPSNLWSSNKIHPETIGETYLIRISLIVDPATGSSNHYMDIELDIGGGIGVIAGHTQILIKASASRYTITLGIFCLSTFVANGGEIYVTPSVNCDIYGKEIYLNRIYKP